MRHQPVFFLGTLGLLIVACLDQVSAGSVSGRGSVSGQTYVSPDGRSGYTRVSGSASGSASGSRGQPVGCPQPGCKDGCKPGWEFNKESGLCIFVEYTDLKDWDEAKQACIDMGAELVRPLSHNMNIWLLGRGEGQSLWISANDNKQEGKWVWLDGTSPKQTFWAKNEPNNKIGPRADCAFVRAKDVAWDDTACEVVRAKLGGYACQRPTFPECN